MTKKHHGQFVFCYFNVERVVLDGLFHMILKNAPKVAINFFVRGFLTGTLMSVHTDVHHSGQAVAEPSKHQANTPSGRLLSFLVISLEF